MNMTPELLQEMQTIQTPSGKHTLELRNVVTGRQKRKYRGSLIAISTDGQSNTADGYDRLENAMIEMVVASLDGSSEGVVDKILDMEAKDYDFVIEKVTEVFSGLSPKEQGISSTSTKTGTPEEK